MFKIKFKIKSASDITTLPNAKLKVKNKWVATVDGY
jgi:hypothetical protein